MARIGQGAFFKFDSVQICVKPKLIAVSRSLLTTAANSICQRAFEKDSQVNYRRRNYYVTLGSRCRTSRIKT